MPANTTREAALAATLPVVPTSREVATREAALAAAPDVLTTDLGAAKMLRCGRSKVWMLMDAGELEWVRIGRSRRVVVASVHGYVARLLREQAGKRVTPTGRVSRSAKRTAA